MQGNQFLWNYNESMDGELQELFNAVAAAGINLFDTADSYGTGRLNGRSESLLGRFIQCAGGRLLASPQTHCATPALTCARMHTLAGSIPARSACRGSCMSQPRWVLLPLGRRWQSRCAADRQQLLGAGTHGAVMHALTVQYAACPVTACTSLLPTPGA